MQKIVAKALTLSNYNHVSTADLNLQLQSHPDYPKLKSITDTLDYFGVANLAASVPKEYIDKLPNMFLALLTPEYSDGYALATKKNDKIILDFENSKREILTRNSFEEKWSGTMVALERASEQKNKVNYSTLILPIILCLIGVCLVYPQFSFLSIALTVLSLGGLYIGNLIVKEELGLHNQVVAKVCTAISSTSCVTTIQSDSSKLFKYFSLADAAVVFFISIFLLNILVGVDYSSYLIILLATIPVLLYSIILQGFVLKQWCVLCIGVILIVIAQFALLISFSAGAILFNLPVLLKSSLTFALTLFGWISVKPLIKSHLLLPATQKDFLTFKRNEKVFQSLLEKKSAILTDDVQANLVTYGAIDSSKVITSITNPFCGYCADHYKHYRNLIQTHGDRFKFNILFNVSAADKENNAYKISIRLIELYHSNKKDLVLTALDEWFANRDVEKWVDRFGFASSNIEKWDAILESQKKWCSSNKINFTPATLINNSVYPQEYKTTDLPFLLDQL